MILPALFFYLFSAHLHRLALMVIAARNPVHSVLFLILAFVNAAGLFLLLGAEFLAMILVVVYVGAVAVLFLFVVMMLDVDFAELREGFLQYLPVGALIGVRLPGRTRCWWSAAWTIGGDRRAWTPAPDADPTITNTEAHRPRALYEVYLLLPGVGPGPAGRDDRRHRADACATPKRAAPEHRRSGRAHEATAIEVVKVQSGQGLAVWSSASPITCSVAAILFTLGIFGIFLNRKNVIIILMSIELILLAVNINLVAFSSFLGDIVGQIFALLVLTVAAAEAAIGLAILVVYFRNRGSIAVEDINLMKG